MVATGPRWITKPTFDSQPRFRRRERGFFVIERNMTATTLPVPKELSDERFEAALDRMTQFSEKIPDLPIEAFSRESFYEGRE